MKNTLYRILHFLPVIFVLLIAIVLTACSSGGATTSKTTASSTYSGNTVSIANFAFSPATLPIPAGTTVTWTNNDSTTHTVTSDNGVFDSGNLAPNATFSYTFSNAGTFAYHCSIHTSMTGKIVVK
jgi:plastocyanin